MVAVLEGHDTCRHLLHLLETDAERFDLLPLVDGDQLFKLMEHMAMFPMHPSFPGPGRHHMNLHLRAEVDVMSCHPQAIEPGSFKGLVALGAPLPPCPCGTAQSHGQRG